MRSYFNSMTSNMSAIESQFFLSMQTSKLSKPSSIVFRAENKEIIARLHSCLSDATRCEEVGEAKNAPQLDPIVRRLHLTTRLAPLSLAALSHIQTLPSLLRRSR